MSRVLLFVSDRDLRPKYKGHATTSVHDRRRPCLVTFDSNLWVTDLQSKHMREAPYWWLVECESVGDGRAIIHDMPKWEKGQTQCAIGRVLASGGAREGTTHPNAGESE